MTIGGVGRTFDGIVSKVNKKFDNIVTKDNEVFRVLTDEKPSQSATARLANVNKTIQRPTDKMSKELFFANGKAIVSQSDTKSNVSASSVLGELRGKRGAAFRTALNEVLKNPEKREALINHYNLNSPKNQQDLGRAMILEAGTGYKKDNMAPVGMVILNRAIGTNVASELAVKSKRFSVSDIMNEKGQFASAKAFNNNRRNDEVSNPSVQSTIKSLMEGSPQATDNQVTAFYFRVGKMKNETFKTSDGHSFSAKYDSGTHYMNGNYLRNAP